MSDASTTSVLATRHLMLTQRLRQRRDELGLTQKQIVTRLAKCGLRTTNRALSSLEHGAGLDVAKLPELATALDCTVTYLIGLTADPHRWEPDEPAVLPAPPRAAPAAEPAQAPAPVVRHRAAPAARSNGSLILGPYLPERRLPRRQSTPPG